MELQNFVNNNPDYQNKFKEKNLYIRKYSLLNLILVKAKHNINYDYDSNPWMRYCRGAIINTKTNRVVCIPPLKSDLKEKIDKNDYKDWIFEPLVDGVMINMFYHENDWIISTRSNIGAKNKWDGKIPFHELFKSVNGTEWFNLLDKNNCYSFTLQHRNNRIITPVYENLIFINEIYNLSDGNIIKLKREEFPVINGIENIIPLEIGDVKMYLEHDNIFSVKGFTIKKDCQRVKWINPNYSYVENLKSNYNNKFFSYLELRRNFKLSEYLKFFPEEKYTFDNYRNNYSSIKREIYESYVSLKIKKEIQWSDVRYEFKPHIKELHNQYMNGKGKITSQYISEYMDKLPIERIYFIYNRLF